MGGEEQCPPETVKLVSPDRGVRSVTGYILTRKEPTALHAHRGCKQ